MEVACECAARQCAQSTRTGHSSPQPRLGSEGWAPRGVALGRRDPNCSLWLKGKPSLGTGSVKGRSHRGLCACHASSHCCKAGRCSTNAQAQCPPTATVKEAENRQPFLRCVALLNRSVAVREWREIYLFITACGIRKDKPVCACWENR
ncbi:hypothetical protein AVEN_936-1 [Araneus ventricosus]|uniref:Uncharacterized protein n=1 Tax=Araneus ventricosus TaxID=182803 RepID=A0A4Y2UNX8_ARAVE|nr:hypothetical protein AVEN_936-1 [Araneus ventricosus]